MKLKLTLGLLCISFMNVYSQFPSFGPPGPPGAPEPSLLGPLGNDPILGPLTSNLANVIKDDNTLFISEANRAVAESQGRTISETTEDGQPIPHVEANDPRSGFVGLIRDSIFEFQRQRASLPTAGEVLRSAPSPANPATASTTSATNSGSVLPLPLNIGSNGGGLPGLPNLSSLAATLPLPGVGTRSGGNTAQPVATATIPTTGAVGTTATNIIVSPQPTGSQPVPVTQALPLSSSTPVTAPPASTTATTTTPSIIHNGGTINVAHPVF